MNKGISINVGGNANAAFGTITQGDNNRISDATATISVENALAAAAREAGVPSDSQALQELEAKLRQLIAEAQNPKPDLNVGAGILKTIRENFEWGYPVVKDTLKIAWPALIALLA